MKIVFGVAGCAVALGLPAIAAPHFVSFVAAQRFGIERTQANPDIGNDAHPSQGAGEGPSKAGKPARMPRRHDPQQDPDEDGETTERIRTARRRQILRSRPDACFGRGRSN